MGHLLSSVIKKNPVEKMMSFFTITMAAFHLDCESDTIKKQISVHRC